MKKYYTLFALLILFTRQISAQPTLDFRRIELSWPQVTLWFQVQCSTNVRYDLGKMNFSLKEDKVPVDNFEVWCPDPSTPCCLSVSLVIDRSGSMAWDTISRIEGAKAGAKAFVDAMQDGCDEAALITFSAKATVDVFMTRDKVLLKSGIDAMVANGGTAVWDAGILGLNSLVSNGINPCKALILLTDGEDNLSTATFDEVVELATIHHIRIFTIGVGSSYNESMLRSAAEYTGGKAYFTHDAAQLVTIFGEIASIFHSTFEECSIKYTTACPNGNSRRVELSLLNLFGCSGATQTKMDGYSAPKDTAQLIPLLITLPDIQARGGDTISIPFTLETPINDTFQATIFELLFDTSCIKFLSVSTQNNLLAPTYMSASPVPGGMEFRTRATFINGFGTLATLRFIVSDLLDDKDCPIRFYQWRFMDGCYRSTPSDGNISIKARKADLVCDVTIPRITFDRNARDYVPNPFTLSHRLINQGDREATNGVATISFDENALTLVSPVSRTQSITPSTILTGVQATDDWTLRVKPRSSNDSIDVCIDWKFDNNVHGNCCIKIFIPATAPLIKCTLIAPKIMLNTKRDGYIPMPFTVLLDVQNEGRQPSDSLFAWISVPPELSLSGKDSARYMKTLLPHRLQAGQHGSTEWDLKHPTTKVQKDYMIRVCVSQKNIDTTCCEIPISIPAIDTVTIGVAELRSAASFVLSQNYPNPFSETTTILLPLLVGEGRGEVVSLKFYDIFGREVLDLSDEARSHSSVTVHSSQFPAAGMYFYRLSVDGISQTKIMVNQ